MKDRLGKNLMELNDATPCLVMQREGKKTVRLKGVIQALHSDSGEVTVTLEKGGQVRVASTDIQL